MVRQIIHDPLFLAQKSEPALLSDSQIAADLMDTLLANRDSCIGLAANMIGVKKRIIVFFNGPLPMVMFNPAILRKHDAYQAEEGCLSLTGFRKTTRWQEITVSWQDRKFRKQTGTFKGYTAQIIQHEVDHCDGILI